MSIVPRIFWALMGLFSSGPRRPLSASQPARPDTTTPLGMEATDLSLVQKTNRKNDALERVMTFSEKGANAAGHVAPLADDESYAAKYHRLYGPKDQNP
ncbi:MAG: hypothetical protein AAGD04_10085 [Pseudomonadota bacterium]